VVVEVLGEDGVKGEDYIEKEEIGVGRREVR
jgi:hypothetical protein